MKTSELKNKLEKSIEFLKTELNKVSTGRAKPSLVENVAIPVYGSMMSIKKSQRSISWILVGIL